MEKQTTFTFIPSSHLDLYWLGNYKTCLERGADVIKQYVDRCLEAPDETFFLETVVFADYFLQKYPDYHTTFRRLIDEGRLEIGSAYVDRWETLVPGESLIRNVQLGKRWYQATFGGGNPHDGGNPTVTHPDLPSMIPQIAQLYSQLGLRYYVTSRKVFRNGQVWRYRAPDGSRLLVLNWPRHYVFPLLGEQDAPEEIRKRIWIPAMEVDETLRGFPLGMVAVSGSAGDLAGRETFVERYGQPLEAYQSDFRAHYPQYRFGYTIPSTFLAPYESYEDLPELAGQIPSVWGVACDEEATFFQRDRVIEARLLAAESMAVAAQALGLDWRPPSAADWQGAFYEEAFFQRKDPIPADQVFRELWRMHVFTQDHNGGGQEGALSTFQKRVTQQRLLTYTGEIHETVLGRLAARLAHGGRNLLAFNSLGQAWRGPLTFTLPTGQWTPEARVLDDQRRHLATQISPREDGSLELTVDLPAVPSLGYRAFSVIETAPAEAAAAVPAPSSTVCISRTESCLTLESAALRVQVDLADGDLRQIFDKSRGQVWEGAPVGQLSAIEECGNDVTLRIAPNAARAEQHLLGVEVLETGPLFTRVLLRKELLKSAVEQTLTFWHHLARLDLETVIYWHGQHHQQIRMALPAAARACIAHGTPFYGAGWDEVVESTGPYNGDEIGPEDQMAYREVHDWLHLRGEQGGLTIVTDHPGFHQQGEALSAVLLRTSPSCGDRRLFFENAGRQVFRFTFLAGAADWRAGLAPQQAQALLRQPAVQFVQAAGGGELPDQMSLLAVEGSGVALSSLYQAEDSADTLARVWNTTGQGGVVILRGLLAQPQARLADLLDTPLAALPGQPGNWQLDLPPYAIRTVRFAAARGE